LRKLKVKSVEESVENYVIGTIQGAFKTKRYWRGQGYDENHAISNAVEYGIGQIKAGVNIQNLEHIIGVFREISGIATAFADMLENAKSNP